MTPFDPFVALWQTALKPDTQQLLRDLQRHQRMHRRFNWTLAAILSAVSLLLMSEEATGRLGTHGWLSAIWLLCLAAGVLWHRRARNQRSDMLERDTVSVLKLLVRQAKRDLYLARCLFAGVPCGAIVGFFVTRLALRQGASTPVDPTVRFFQTAVAIAVLVAMMVIGAVLARSRRIQVQELSEQLELIDSGL